MSNTLNPHREGDFLIYGEAAPLPDGRWSAVYWIDLHPEGQPVVERMIERRVMGGEPFATESLAVLAGIHYGIYLVMNGFNS